MKNIDVETWEQFDRQIKDLEEERVLKKTASPFLYRGQGCHTFKLSTTLERNGQEGIALKEYHRLAFAVKPQIESFTGTRWDILSYPDDIQKWLQENDTTIPNAFGWRADFQETYSYMAYLRHYGFPSPFLDWTGSPYIAAYFAFRNASPSSSRVSIYAYLESTSEISLKLHVSPGPLIDIFGPYVRTDRRHFLQQSRYTICISRDPTPSGEWRYASHEDVLSRGNAKQDVLWKFNIPSSERLKVLKLLDHHYNINAISLFGSEESLTETLALREIHFKNMP